MIDALLNVAGAVLMLGVLLGMAVVVLWIRDRRVDARWRRRNPPEKIAAERAAKEAQILQPDWDYYERHLGRPAPQALRELYADRELITAQDLDVGEDWSISTFQALREQNLTESQAWLGFDTLAIATTDWGDPVYLRPGAREENFVYVTSHDGSETEVFADSVEALVVRIKNGRRSRS